MRLIINEGGEKDVCLRLPCGLVLNRLSADIVSVILKNKGVNISGKQLNLLFQAIKAYKTTHPEWKFIEINGNDGETMEIVI